MRHSGLLNRNQAMLLVIDVQERLLNVYAHAHAQRVVARTGMMIKGAKLFDLPVIVTEQYPKGIGPSHRQIRSLIGSLEPPIVKDTMSCCGCPPSLNAIEKLERKQVIVCGIEAHVCVFQTALDLHSGGYQVHLCADATGSRRSEDYKTAIARMGQSGIALTTAESALFQLLEDSRDAKLKRVLEIVK